MTRARWWVLPSPSRRPRCGQAADALRKAVDPAGEPIYAGKDEFAKALKLISEGKPIRYEGVIGPVNFDQYGDISGPFRLWQIVDGKVTTVGEMTTADVEAIKASMK
jgi:ABC-type branched-subunit amino acid transport system substrate-binding protein